MLHDVSFSVQPGETIAIVARNGAGKTTLIKLLFRLYDPTAGRVLIDSHDLRDYDPLALRQQMSAVFQDQSQYQMTARENIGLGRLDQIDDLAAIASAAEQGGTDDGRLIEQGKHDQLIALGGRYAHLCTLQAAAYVGKGIEGGGSVAE